MIESKQLEGVLEEMVQAIISSDAELFLVAIKLKGNPGNQRLIILIDGDSGVTIDQCSSISRQLSKELEEKDLIDGKYTLEVSSAGVDHPLQSIRQYKKNIGRSLKVTLTSGDQLEGELKNVEEGSIELESRKKNQVEKHLIKFEEIEKSIVLVSFK